MSKKKGDKRERQARNILTDAHWLVENPNWSRYQNKDFFNLFDFMAAHPDENLLFGQVKSNRAAGIKAFSTVCAELFDLENIDIQYWVCYKGEGWRIIDIKEDGSYEDIIDERDLPCNMGDGVTEAFQKDSTIIDKFQEYQETENIF